MWCEITERKVSKGKLYICLENDEGQEVRPNHLQDASGNKYTAMYKPEHSPFFELRPSDKEKEWAFKDRLEVLD